MAIVEGFTTALSAIAELMKSHAMTVQVENHLKPNSWNFDIGVNKMQNPLPSNLAPDTNHTLNPDDSIRPGESDIWAYSHIAGQPPSQKTRVLYTIVNGQTQQVDYDLIIEPLTIYSGATILNTWVLPGHDLNRFNTVTPTNDSYCEYNHTDTNFNDKHNFSDGKIGVKSIITMDTASPDHQPIFQIQIFEKSDFSKL